MPLSLAASLVLALSLAGGAAASGAPIRGSFDDGYISFVDTEVCAAAPWGFDVNATEHEYGFYEVWFDANDNVVRAIVHLNYDAWISANGNTIVERDTWTLFIDADGTARGPDGPYSGPGGSSVRDAGEIVRDADGSLRYVRGPHEQLFSELLPGARRSAHPSLQGRRPSRPTALLRVLEAPSQARRSSTRSIRRVVPAGGLDSMVSRAPLASMSSPATVSTWRAFPDYTDQG
jgi:hypothetical protein